MGKMGHATTRVPVKKRDERSYKVRSHGITGH
jgi:hypothetical protein